MDDTLSIIRSIQVHSDNYLLKQLERRGVHDITLSLGRIVYVLNQYETLPMQDIASIVSRDPSTVTSSIKKLKKLGYVTAFTDASDKRRCLVCTTDKGRQLAKCIAEISAEVFNIQYNHLSESDISALRKGLVTLDNNFKHSIRKREADDE